MAKKLSESNVKALVIVLISLICLAIIAVVIFIVIFINDITGDNDNESVSNTDNTNTTNTLEENAIDYEYPIFDESKVIRSAEDSEKEITYNIKEYDSRGLFSATIVDNKVYISKEDLSGNFNSIYPNSSLNTGESYEISNITENIIDIHFGYVGTDYNRLILVVLAENGDVKYVDLSTTTNLDGNFVASDVIANNIVRIENVFINEDNSNRMSIILISNNESAYNVEDLI